MIGEEYNEQLGPYTVGCIKRELFVVSGVRARTNDKKMNILIMSNAQQNEERIPSFSSIYCICSFQRPALDCSSSKVKRQF